MQLKSLISGLSVEVALCGSAADADPEVTSLAYDSRRVQQGSLFLAVKGKVTDGNLWVMDALRRGAKAVASELPPPCGVDVVWVRVGEMRPLMALLADRFFDSPSRRVELVGVTGTNGKTTTTFVIHSVLGVLGPALLMGTVKTAVADSEMESVHTTPEAIDLQQTLREAEIHGCRYGAMEVSSHALAQYRTYGCRFPIAVFVNLTLDHLDFHGTMEAYRQAKQRLFDLDYNPGLRCAVLNADDQACAGVAVPAGVKRLFFGRSAGADVRPVRFETTVSGTEVDLEFLGRRLNLRSSLIGSHNLYNLMAAATACSCLGAPDEAIREGVARLRQVPGRFEKVDVPAPFSVVVDYAHTPDALENSLSLARQLAAGRVICVFGCGGDRDRGKRPVMGEIAARLSDRVIITSDNPRSEDPQRIVEEIRRGVDAAHDNYEVVVDRRQAIARALRTAAAGDLVLIAGKGHENYQVIQDQRIHFDDREVAREVL
jgi:UDP-N-acetylmuramoyl-L-alanyl-D-glutamate--2,6-diaminopimelate ligase